MEFSLPSANVFCHENVLLHESLCAGFDTVIIDIANNSWAQFIAAVERSILGIKPGGMILAIVSHTTWHRYAYEIESRGLEVKDCLNIVRRDSDQYCTHVIIAMKQYHKTYFENALLNRVAGFWISGNRIGNKKSGWNGLTAKGGTWTDKNCGLRKTGNPTNTFGKFPSNFIIASNTTDAQLRDHFQVLSGDDTANIASYLCRLTKTPYNGNVLDPLMTGCSIYLAARKYDRAFTGIVPDIGKFEFIRSQLCNA